MGTGISGHSALPVGIRGEIAVLGAILAGVLGALVAYGAAHGRVSLPAAPSSVVAGLGRLPAGAREPVSAALGGGALSFWATRRGDALLVRNSSQRLAARFSRAGVAVLTAGGSVSLSLRAIGYGRRLTTVGPAAPWGATNRVFYARQGVEEWYLNGPLGIEQGFTVAAPGRGPVTIELRLGGSLRPRLEGAGAISFVSAGGMPIVRYGSLRVTDAQGRTLPASISLNHGTLLIRVLRATRYPLTVDPLIQAARLTGAGESGRGQFGSSVAISADGRTLLVGAPLDDNFNGAAYVFTRSGGTWVQQGHKLTAPDQSGGAYFGTSVALSADGNTALIGGPRDQTLLGAAWVYTRSGTTWSESAKLSGSPSQEAMGSSVSLSADGQTALVGAEQGNLAAGAVVFTHSIDGWVQQASLISPAADSGASIDGYDTTLSGDGNTALVGGVVNNLAGAVWVFSRSGLTWSRQARPLTPSNENGPSQFGLTGMVLSDGGDTAVIGGAEDHGGTGAAWVYTRSRASWRQGPKLTAAPNVMGFGDSIGLSGGGKTTLIGAPDTLQGNTIAVGAAWIFTRSGSRWIQEGPRLTGGNSEGLGFGASAALSSDGTTALIGETSGEAASTGVGAAAVFVLVPHTRITSARIKSLTGSATFSFRAIGAATGFRCALVKTSRHGRHRASFSRCHSPKIYRHLTVGRYTFLARAMDGAAGDPTPARRTFHIG